MGMNGMYARRKNIRICVVLLFVGMFVTLAQQHHLQQDYANEVLRFHVIANSDEEADQALKLQVRNCVGAYVSTLLKDARDKAETEAIVSAHLDDITAVAKKEIAKQGYTYPVCAAIEQVDFPEKFYGKYHLPEGTYTSLQVRIGQAQGANWWCVMYPNMCFRDNTYEVVGTDEKEQMYEVFTLYQYKKLIESPHKEIRFRYF